jgi:hypothetical protein
VPKPVIGRCYCGAVQFHLDEPPIATRACWCRDCQYLATGNASVNAIFKRSTLKVTGELSVYVSTADSGSVMNRRFCPRCGTQLFSESSRRPDLIVVRVGALDDRQTFRPSSFIWTASAPAWGYVDTRSPNCEGQPEPPPDNSPGERR